MATQPRLVNKQFNSPIGLYSAQNVREVLDRDTQILANGAVGVNFYNPAVGKSQNLQNSAVLRMLEEEDNRQRNGHPSNDYAPKSLRENVSWPPPQYEIKNKIQGVFKDTVVPGVKRVAWPPPHQEGLEGEASEQAPVQSQGGAQLGQANLSKPLNQAAAAPAAAAPASNHQQKSRSPLHVQTSPSPIAQSPLSPSGFRPQTPTKQWAPVHSPTRTPQQSPLYQQPQPLYQAPPQPQYQAPIQQQYQTPQQYQVPVQQYQAPPQQYQPSLPQYQAPPQPVQQNQALPPQYQQPPQQQYQQPPPQQYQVPVQQYQAPPQQYQPPQQQYQAPSPQPQQYQAPTPQPQQYQSPTPQQYQPIVNQGQQASQNQAAPRSAAPAPVKQVEPPPSIIQLRPQAPVSQAPQPVYTSQPATATLRGGNHQGGDMKWPPEDVKKQNDLDALRLQGSTFQPSGKHLRGDLKWPPEDVRERMQIERVQLEEISRGPAIRPRKNLKDYSGFYAQNQLNDTYPRYVIPPGTQFFRPV